MKETSHLKTKIAVVRGLGPGKSGTHHFWLQRITAVALVPLTLWFVVSLLIVAMTPDVQKVVEWFSCPLNAIAMVLMLVAGFWHAKLGLQVIIEDYVHEECCKYTLLIANIFGCVTLAAISILAVLKLHFLDVISGSV
jgi:succinate dehydrogenase / fumarate reductase membrane anchor subunit